MKLQRLRRLVRRRIRYRITRGGVLFGLALVLTGAGAFLSANNLLFLVFSAMLALLLVSGFLSQLVLSGLELELLLPEHVSALTATPARVRVRNVKRLTPSFSIELAGQHHAATDTPSILTAPVYFTIVPGRTAIEAAVDVNFPRRGRHRENLFVFSTRFPFGFLRKTTRVTLRRETIVYPSLEPCEEAEQLLDAVAGEMAAHLKGVGLDFYRIRPYEMTDSARLVDWKSTAHTGALQVREFSRERQRAVEVYLDRRVPAGGAEPFERMLERCAYLVWNLADAETELWFRSQSFLCRLPDDGEVYAILRFLALVEPLAGDATGAEPPIDDASLQIVFSAQPESFHEAGWARF